MAMRLSASAILPRALVALSQKTYSHLLFYRNARCIDRALSGILSFGKASER
jgi:hypothetical protein